MALDNLSPNNGILPLNGTHSIQEETPDALPAEPAQLSEEEQVRQVEEHFGEIMRVLGLDLTDDSLQGTPRRVAKMMVKDLFSGLKPENEPAITLFENTYHYHQLLVEKNIEVHTMCEHHFLPIVGHAHVAYIPRDKVVGLSKLNRVVHYFAKRPQVQERMTQQIAAFLVEKLQTPDVAVFVDAEHHCVKMRGVEDPCSSTVTTAYHGAFQEQATRSEFLAYAGLR
jgi:GTP cyclohydrolase I